MNNATDVAKQAARSGLCCPRPGNREMFVSRCSLSAVLTRDGLSGVLQLIQVGRQIHGRIENWIVNKVVKVCWTLFLTVRPSFILMGVCWLPTVQTFQNILFIVVSFLVTGKFIVSAFHQVVLLFLIDFVTGE